MLHVSDVATDDLLLLFFFPNLFPNLYFTSCTRFFKYVMLCGEIIGYYRIIGGSPSSRTCCQYRSILEQLCLHHMIDFYKIVMLCAIPVAT